MQESQVQQPAIVILQLTDQRLARTVLGLGMDDFTFDLRLLADP